MKTKLIFTVLFVVLTLVACAQATVSSPTKTATPTQTSASMPPTSTLTPTPPTWWTIKGTPLNLSYSNSRKIDSTIDQLFPDFCFGFMGNLAIKTPLPGDVMLRSLDVEFTEIDVVPTPDMLYGYIQADNINKTRTAYSSVIDAANLYITDNTNNKIYEFDLGSWPVLEGLRWINADTIVFLRQAHSGSVVSAINVATQQYEYYSESSGCPATSMP